MGKNKEKKTVEDGMSDMGAFVNKKAQTLSDKWLHFPFMGFFW